ncbi:hypothetical protein PGIGA_G00240420 [Pangasianodon gigas]|uniref:Uncharacterized protein n=1 Tax=Pangasianodon gigas TaxID=30993 RepID=A0ACC5WNM5_PANGG|nr:hypothetical protein [Pangasianodon gigas]
MQVIIHQSVVKNSHTHTHTHTYTHTHTACKQFMVTAVFQSRRCTIMLRCIVLLLFWGFSSSSPTITLLVGSQFRLQCLIEFDLLSPEYSWSFTPQLNVDQGVKIPFTPLSHTEEMLELNPVEQHHAGTYKCVVRGISEKGATKVKRTFQISVIENVPFIRWQVLEGTEGEPAMLPCSSETVKSFDSALVKWFKIKELGDSFEAQELTPVERSHSSIKGEEIKNEDPARRVYWASDLKEPDWSIEIDSLELDDESLYRCDIKTESNTESWLMELVLNRAPPPRCLNHTAPWEACPDPDSKSSEAILHESLTEFSLNVYKKVNMMAPERNLLFSPISITMLLSHLLLGTRGQTRTELERGLLLPPYFSCIHSEMKKLNNKMKDSILVASQMFFNQKLKLQEAFVNQSQEFYDSVPQKLTNNSETNLKLINDWVASKSQNRITGLVDFLDESTEIILLNAVYFIGKWKGTFEVKDEVFTTFSKGQLSVPTLYSSSFYLSTSYIHALKAHVGKFDLTGKNSLYILLPISEGKKGLQATEASLTESNIREMVKEMASVIPALSEVTLPKVKLMVNTDLLTLLKKFELAGLLEDPNLCGMFEQSSSTPLTDARHRAFLSLTEKGVEAVAASSISFSRSFGSFDATRPFVLMVWNEDINNPLFIGRVLNPKKDE